MKWSLLCTAVHNTHTYTCTPVTRVCIFSGRARAAVCRYSYQCVLLLSLCEPSVILPEPLRVSVGPKLPGSSRRCGSSSYFEMLRERLAGASSGRNASLCPLRSRGWRLKRWGQLMPLCSCENHFANESLINCPIWSVGDHVEVSSSQKAKRTFITLN